MDLNSVNLTGRLGEYATLKSFESGDSVAEFSVAIDAGRDRTTWVTVKYWLSEDSKIANYLDKGQRVGITGKLTQERWKDRESNVERSRLVVTARRIVLLSSEQPEETEPDL